MTPHNFKTNEYLSSVFRMLFEYLVVNLFSLSEYLMLLSLKCQYTIIKLHQETLYATIENYEILE